MNSRKPVSRLRRALPFSPRWRAQEHSRTTKRKMCRPTLKSVPFVPATPDRTAEDETPLLHPDPTPYTLPTVDIPFFPDYAQPVDFTANFFGAETTGLEQGCQFLGSSTKDSSRKLLDIPTSKGSNLGSLEGLNGCPSRHAEPYPPLPMQEDLGSLIFGESFELEQAPEGAQGSTRPTRERNDQHSRFVWGRTIVNSTEAICRRINEEFVKLSENMAYFQASACCEQTTTMLVHNSLSRSHMQCMFEFEQADNHGYFFGTFAVVVYDYGSERAIKGRRRKPSVKNKTELATVDVAEAEGTNKRRIKEKMCTDLVSKLDSDQFAVVLIEGRWKLIRDGTNTGRNVPERPSSSRTQAREDETELNATSLLKQQDSCVKRVGNMCHKQNARKDLEERRQQSGLEHGQGYPLGSVPDEKNEAPSDLRTKLEQMRSSLASKIQSQLSSVQSKLDEAQMDLRRKLDQKHSGVKREAELPREKTDKYGLVDKTKTPAENEASMVLKLPSTSTAAPEGTYTALCRRAGLESAVSSAVLNSTSVFKPPRTKPDSRPPPASKRPCKAEAACQQSKPSDGKRPYGGSFDAPVTKQMKLDLGKSSTRSHQLGDSVPQMESPRDFKKLVATLTEILAARKKRISEYNPRNVLMMACKAANLDMFLSCVRVQKKVGFKWRVMTQIEAEVMAKRSGWTPKCAATKSCHAAIERLIRRHKEQDQVPTRPVESARYSTKAVQHHAASAAAILPPPTGVKNKLDSEGCEISETCKQARSACQLEAKLNIFQQTLVVSRVDVLTQEEEAGPAIPEHNRGSMLLRKLGWAGGGIGKTESGIEVPVAVRQEVFRRQCLGTATATGIPVDFPGKFSKALEAFVACSLYSRMEIHSDFNSQEQMVLKELCKRHSLILSFLPGPKAVILHRREVQKTRRLKNLKYEDVDSSIRSELPPPPGCRIIPPKSSQ